MDGLDYVEKLRQEFRDMTNYRNEVSRRDDIDEANDALIQIQEEIKLLCGRFYYPSKFELQQDKVEHIEVDYE